MIQNRTIGYGRRMEETPICASVERDLNLDVEDLIAGVVPETTPPSAPSPRTQES
jgi:hypothetical protein